MDQRRGQEQLRSARGSGETGGSDVVRGFLPICTDRMYRPADTGCGPSARPSARSGAGWTRGSRGTGSSGLAPLFPTTIGVARNATPCAPSAGRQSTGQVAARPVRSGLFAVPGPPPGLVFHAPVRASRIDCECGDDEAQNARPRLLNPGRDVAGLPGKTGKPTGAAIRRTRRDGRGEIARCRHRDPVGRRPRSDTEGPRLRVGTDRGTPRADPRSPPRAGSGLPVPDETADAQATS